MKEWVKLHTQLLADPKIGTLSWAHRGMWSAMLALAGLIDDRDALDLETGKLDTLENVAWHLRCEVEMLAGALAELTRRGMVDDRDGILYLTDYGKRQARPPSASREAIAGRVRRCRARKQGASPAGDEGQAGGSRSPPRVRGDSRGGSEDGTSLQAPGNGVTVTQNRTDRTKHRPDTEQAQTTDTEPEPAVAAVAAATALGVAPEVARNLVQAHGPPAVLGWARAIPRLKGIQSPPAFLVAQLRKGVPAPPPPQSDHDRWVKHVKAHPELYES